MPRLKTIEWINNCARIIDQTALPSRLVYKDITTPEEMHEAIKTLAIRGAPAIGVAAAFGLYLGIRGIPDDAPEETFTAALKKKAEYLISSRPTAVNLPWAVRRMMQIAGSAGPGIAGRKKA